MNRRTFRFGHYEIVCAIRSRRPSRAVLGLPGARSAQRRDCVGVDRARADAFRSDWKLPK
jgi:hypothetical protein